MDKMKQEFAMMQKEITIVSTKLDEHCKTQKEDFERIYTTLNKIDSKFDNLNNVYATKIELKATDKEIKEMKGFRKNILSTISAILAIILSAIAIFRGI